MGRIRGGEVGDKLNSCPSSSKLEFKSYFLFCHNEIFITNLK